MPVLNLPSAERLHDFALSLHFDAWERLLRLIEDFEMDEQGDFKARADEWAAFTATANRELEMTTSYIAQASELAMKATLCEVSPYLLLLGHGDALKSGKTNIDFSDLRTIDAVDLPNAIKVFGTTPLPDRFIDSFNELRKLRNKSTHMGESFTSLDPKFLVEALTVQFCSLWPNRRFLHEWLRLSERGTNSYWKKDENWSRENHVFRFLPFLQRLLTKGQFKRLLNREKSTRRYLCLKCLYEAENDWSDWHLSEIQTCFLSESGDTLECEVCLQSYPVTRQKCLDGKCRGNVISGNHPEVDAGLCHTCRQDQEELAASAKKPPPQPDLKIV
ncbi:hypothetical protein PSM7751_00636 [Pseudooceanicola marinus]|uniref:Uncharacterized protein n=1 Tax=Pseudooceanicola marinus TaxID=396013 RepID=A0A1X6YFJ3_9RHOB|nr:hypothetical protein [Pseudooceanicola marinus]SLN19800.1 hypothetical protein PSM7751_00636 [Pseudooceanicola marinus]